MSCQLNSEHKAKGPFAHLILREGHMSSHSLSSPKFRKSVQGILLTALHTQIRFSNLWGPVSSATWQLKNLKQNVKKKKCL